MRYRLRTLLLVLALAPPLLAGAWFAAVWITHDGNLEIAGLTLLLSAVYVACVVLAVWAKRLTRAALALASRRMRG